MIQSLSELEQARQRLALDVEEGKPGALKDLEQVEQAIAQLKRDEERATLAATERASQAAAAQAARKAAERQQLEEEHRRNDAAVPGGSTTAGSRCARCTWAWSCR
jgi:hypothetical protein